MLVRYPPYQIAQLSLNQNLNGIPVLRVRTSPTPETMPLLFIYPPILSSKFYLPLKCGRSTITVTEKEESFTVSYLINNFGFSPQKARLVAKRVKFDDCERPAKVVKFFRNYGFSDFQIQEIIQLDARLLVSLPEKTILPKLEFLLSQGFSKPELIEIVTASPILLRRSLENQIIPMVHLVKSFHQSNTKKAIPAIKTSLSNLTSMTRVEANITFLRRSGMPDSKIAIMFPYRTSGVLNMNSECFQTAVAEIKEMGFDISKSTFAVALGALKTVNKSKWQRKLDIYKKWGWSEQDFLCAFRRGPWCMLTSEHKIETVMDCFVNQLGWDSVLLAKYPILFRTSLEKRIIPRARVIQYLLSNGLIRDKYFSAFGLSEQRFLGKFVEPFVEDAPRLLELYQGKINVFS